jgi:parallel beta-helix repeat protein
MRRKARERFSNHPYKRIAAVIAICAASIAGQAFLPAMEAHASVTLSPGADIQSAIDSHPAGTDFILRPGLYRMQSLRPQAGDSFTGQTGADLNGSQVLTNWVKRGSYWTSSGDPALNDPYGDPSQYCLDPSTGCVYPQDLYLNDAPLVHKLKLPISSGQWYFDYGTDVIYLAENPTGQTVELGVAPQAFYGPATNVTVENLIVEKYATRILSGAIATSGSGWTIKSNEVRLNHAAGIKPANGSDDYEQILSNNVHDNGQEGISVGGGTGTLVEYNTISGNNYLNLSDGFESGGGKIAGATNARVLNNTYSDNNGNGFWGDVGDTGLVFSGNTITGSRLSGIRYEISHYGTFANNTLTNNDQYLGRGACSTAHSDIFLYSSDHTSVSGNTITSNCAGIGIHQDSRNPVVYDSVTHNTITYPGSVVLANPIGATDGENPMTVFEKANHNYFDYNTYHFSSPVLLKMNWTWNSNGSRTFSWRGWQGAGEDPNGTAN